jgi:hypothetical protein
MNHTIRKKIFALYPNQQRTRFQTFNISDAERLLLRSLDMLSDNEVHTITEQLWSQDEAINIPYDELRLKIKNLFNFIQPQEVALNSFLNVVDQLRSNGYALPAFGYSVEQMIKENIVEIRIIQPDILITNMSYGVPIDNTPVEDNSLKRKGNKSKSLETLLKKK